MDTRRFEIDSRWAGSTASTHVGTLPPACLWCVVHRVIDQSIDRSIGGA